MEFTFGLIAGLGEKNKKNPVKTGLRLALCWREKQVTAFAGLPLSTTSILHNRDYHPVSGGLTF
jgi:hypothetical protein